MNGKPTISTVHAILGRLEADIVWLTAEVVELKGAFDKHCEKTWRTWLWALPTVLLLIDLAYTLTKELRNHACP